MLLDVTVQLSMSAKPFGSITLTLDADFNSAELVAIRLVKGRALELHDSDVHERHGLRACV